MCRLSAKIFICRKEGFFMYNPKFEYKSVLASQIRLFLKMKESAGISALRTKWILKEIDDFVTRENLTEPTITRSLIENWRKTRQSDKDNTLYAKYSVWSQLANFMCRNGYDCFIPKLPKQHKSDFTPYIFTQKQIADIIGYVDNMRLYDIRMSTTLFVLPSLIRLLYSTGLRISEALSIKNEDVYWEERYIHVKKTKNGSERIVPICGSLYAVLQQYVEYRNKMPLNGTTIANHLFFIKPDGTGILACSVLTYFRKALISCGIPYIGNHHGPRIHDLRHTFAVHSMAQMGLAGMDLYAALPILSTCLGHHSISATEQYVRLTCVMYPELEQQCSPLSAYIYPKTQKRDGDEY